jgi:hypothetical protein
MPDVIIHLNSRSYRDINRNIVARGSLLGNDSEPLLSNGFANKHVPMATVELQQRETVFSVRSVPNV